MYDIPCGSSTQPSNHPTHVAIYANNHVIVIPAWALANVMQALTNDKLCGMSKSYTYSSEAANLTPDQMTTDFEVKFFTPKDVNLAKISQLEKEVESERSSKNFWSKKFDEVKQQVKELEAKLADIAAKATPTDDIF